MSCDLCLVARSLGSWYSHELCKMEKNHPKFRLQGIHWDFQLLKRAASFYAPATLFSRMRCKGVGEHACIFASLMLSITNSLSQVTHNMCRQILQKNRPMDSHTSSKQARSSLEDFHLTVEQRSCNILIYRIPIIRR